MVGKQHVYAVARICSKELSLLPSTFLEQPTATKSYNGCIWLLTEKGWGDDNAKDAETTLTTERRKAWGLISELTEGMSVFNMFLYANDYHNLKAAIRGVCIGHEYLRIYTDQGTVDVRLIHDVIGSREFQNPPGTTRVSAEEVCKALLYIQDGQLCGIVVNRAALEATHHAGKSSDNEFLRLYTELTVIATDIKTAVWAFCTDEDRTFSERALTPYDTLDTIRLVWVAIEGMDAIGIYLESITYTDAIEELHRSPSAFEWWCNDLVARKIKSQQYNLLGLGPSAVYILVRENRIKSIRIVLSGKFNHFSEESIRGGVGGMCV